MDTFNDLLLAAVLIFAFDILALRFGVDSRRLMTDDWARRWPR